MFFVQAFGDGLADRRPVPVLKRILCQRNSSARSASAHRLADRPRLMTGASGFLVASQGKSLHQIVNNDQISLVLRVQKLTDLVEHGRLKLVPTPGTPAGRTRRSWRHNGQRAWPGPAIAPVRVRGPRGRAGARPGNRDRLADGNRLVLCSAIAAWHLAHREYLRGHPRPGQEAAARAGNVNETMRQAAQRL